MNKRISIVAAIVAAVALGAVPFVYAQGMGRHHRGGGDGFGMFLGHLDRVQQDLGLSDQQVAQIKAIAADVHTQNQAYRAQLRGGMQSVSQTLLADPNNIAGAQQIIDQQDAAKKAMRANVLAGVSKALNVLTPDQRTRLGQFLATRAANHKGHVSE